MGADLYSTFGDQHICVFVIHREIFLRGHFSINDVSSCVKYFSSDSNRSRHSAVIWPFMGTLKLQSNGPLYSNTVIGTPAVDGWAVTFAVPFSLYQM